MPSLRARTAVHLTILQLVAAAMANKSIMRTITLHKTARSAARSPINQPSKNDKYSVTKNTTRVVVLKVPPVSYTHLTLPTKRIV